MGEVWSKISPFDHEHIAVTSYYVITLRDDVPCGFSIQTYSGKLSTKQSAALLPENWKAIDLDRTLKTLQRKGYMQATPAPAPVRKPEKAARKTEKKVEAAEPVLAPATVRKPTRAKGKATRAKARKGGAK